MNRQISVGDSKNVIVFDLLLTRHVIRRMRSGRVCIFNGNQWETLSVITQERIGVRASTLVGIIDVGVDACGILSRSIDVGEIDCNRTFRVSSTDHVISRMRRETHTSFNTGRCIIFADNFNYIHRRATEGAQ